MGYNPSSASSSSSSSSVELYPEEVQLKLYEAFIFSIPILIAIILLLLLYLFYLKRRTTETPPPLHHLPISAHPNSNMAGERFMISSSSSSSLKLNHQVVKLQTVLLNQVLTTVTDSTCCVCLGEFELEDVLEQIPACRHVFHADCIRLWLISNATCPLCRCFIHSHHPPPPPPIYS